MVKVELLKYKWLIARTHLKKIGPCVALKAVLVVGTVDAVGTRIAVRMSAAVRRNNDMLQFGPRRLKTRALGLRLIFLAIMTRLILQS